MSEILNELYKLTNFKKGCYKLDAIQRVADRLKVLHSSFKIIHVAGTNGKGSVSFKIARALCNQGKKVGLFTSPHLSTFRERIQINSQYIPETLALKTIQEIFKVYKELKLDPTFFEIMTLLALLHFKREKVDYAVLEVGLGGRLDATNIVNPILTVITSISLDHEHILGNSLEKIAYEKGGIIKTSIPLVLGPTAKLEPILTLAKQACSRVYILDKAFEFYEEENQELSLLALRVLKKIDSSISPRKVKESLPCRFEVHKNVVFDVAHNKEGVNKLFSSLKKTFPGKDFRFLVAISKDKDLKEILKKIDSFAFAVHPLALGERLTPAETICQYLTNPFVEVSFEKSVMVAHKKAEEQGQILVVTGSFFHMHEVKNILGFSARKDQFDLNEKNLTSFS